MADPRHVRPHELEILVARELRKAGLEVAPPRTLSRRALSGRDESDYVVELSAVITRGDVSRTALIECRNVRRPVGPKHVRALAARLAAPSAGASPERPEAGRLGMMFSASGYDPAAAREAQALGIPLFAIADGPAAFRRSQWAMGTQTPAWVPEYMAELVDLDTAGTLRHRLLGAGGPTVSLAR
jgi:hypothetical protein